MKLPRDLKADTLVKRLGRLGYNVVRQRGSHMTVKTESSGGHTIWIPAGKPLAVGTLRNILGQVSAHAGIEVNELLQLLDL